MSCATVDGGVDISYAIPQGKAGHDEVEAQPSRETETQTAVIRSGATASRVGLANHLAGQTLKGPVERLILARRAFRLSGCLTVARLPTVAGEPAPDA